MRIFVIKRVVILFVLLLGYSAVNAADGDLITKQITIKLDKAGTLQDKIGETKKYKITNLKIVGEINGSDWLFIREMAGCGWSYGAITDGHLSVLDLAEAKIMEDKSNPYFTDGTKYYMSTDKIGDYAFARCESLISIILPISTTSIGDYAFKDLKLTKVAMSPGITKIGEYAFYGCSGLMELTLPSSVTKIGKRAFEGCSSLTSLVLPASVMEIGEYAFEGCSSLTSLALPTSITKMGHCAFWGCSGLTSLTIPFGVTLIGSAAFSNCSSLTSLTIPSSVTSIGYSAFKDCSGLTSLSLSSSVTSIGDDAFMGCSDLKNVQYQINDDMDTYLSKDHPCIDVNVDEIKYSLKGEAVTSITIPSQMTKVGEYVFQKCKSLTSVHVGWKTPWKVSLPVFSGINKQRCTLYIPQSTYQDYWLADVWGDFENIVEYDTSGIDKVTDMFDTQEVSRYSVNGQRLSAPTKGLNIVKYSDGSVKKVAVQ